MRASSIGYEQLVPPLSWCGLLSSFAAVFLCFSSAISRHLPFFRLYRQHHHHFGFVLISRSLISSVISCGYISAS
jgi:hypothetical protein